jgi:hypothetical protein
VRVCEAFLGFDAQDVVRIGQGRSEGMDRREETGVDKDESSESPPLSGPSLTRPGDIRRPGPQHRRRSERRSSTLVGGSDCV